MRRGAFSLSREEAEMGTVRKKGKKWYAFWTDAQGKRRCKSVSPLKRDAEAFLHRVEGEIRGGVVGGYKAVPFSQAAEEYCEQVAIKRKPATYANAERIMRLRLVPWFGDKPVGAVTRKDCDAYAFDRVTNGSSAPGTVRNEIGTLIAFMDFAVRWGYAVDNPARGMEKPKRRSNAMAVLDAQQLRKLIEGAEGRYAPIFATAGLTGLRAGEISGLMEKDIDFANHVVHVRRNVFQGKITTVKTENSVRDVDMPAHLEEMLRAWLASPLRPQSRESLVFPNIYGGILNMSTVREHALYKTLDALDLPHIRFHDLRHTYASLLIAQGEPLTYVRDMLGHASVRTTADVYGHLLYETRRSAAAKLDGQVFGSGDGAR